MNLLFGQEHYPLEQSVIVLNLEIITAIFSQAYIMLSTKKFLQKEFRCASRQEIVDPGNYQAQYICWQW